MTAYLLSGMGADASLYTRPWRELPGCRFVEWPAWRGERTLRDVALRLIESESITAEDCVGGTSLGGMVAAEIARILQSRAVLLIASAVRREEIRPAIRTLIPLAAVMPFSLTQRAAGLFRSAHLARMYHRSDPAFVRAMCLAVGAWEGLDDSPVAVYRLHGTRDWIIPRPATPADRLDGGHLLILTHAAETAAWAAGVLRRLDAAP